MEVVLSLNYIMDAEKDNFLKWVLLEFFINFDGKMESWTDQNAYQDDVEVDWWIGEKIPILNKLKCMENDCGSYEKNY